MLRSEQRLRTVLTDRIHGSRTITRGILETLQYDLAPEPIALNTFVGLARRILSAAPSFALVFDLLHHVGRSAYTDADSVPPDVLQAHTGAWAERWRLAQRAMHLRAGEILHRDATVVTYSASGAVYDLLDAAQDAGLGLVVVGSEALPGGEGKPFLEQVGSLGHRTELVSDPELASRVSTSDLVLLGADAVFADSFWNKSGSASLCRAAQAAGVPVYVAAESLKWVPADWGLHIDPAAGGSEALFEPVPLDLATGVLCESGLAASGRVAAVIAAKAPFDSLMPRRV